MTGIIVIVIMGLFPPIAGSYASSGRNNPKGYSHLGPSYGFLLTSSTVKPTGDLIQTNADFIKHSLGRNWFNVIDIQKLLIQWFIAAAVTAGAIVSIKDTEAKPKE